MEDGQYRLALGLAIETKRLDIFRKAVTDRRDQASTNEMLSYAYGVVMGLIQNRTYRGELLRELATPD